MVKTTEDDYKIQELGLTNCTSGSIQQANILTGVGYSRANVIFCLFLQENNGNKEEVSEEADRETQQE